MAVRRLTVNNNKRQSGHGQRLLRGVRSRSLTIIIYLFPAAISVTVFGQTIRYDFVNFDDDLYVYDTPGVSKGLTINGILAAFTHPHAHNWHPLTTISHMLDCQLYGLNAGGHHFTSVVLHTIAVLLLFRVLRMTMGALWPSAFVAALFAIHPLHVESVAWVSERKDVLSAVFFMLTLAAYVRYVRATSPGRYFSVAMIFALGLMSKPMLVTAPFVLLLLDYWPLRRSAECGVRSAELHETRNAEPGMLRSGFSWDCWGQLLLEKVPFFALSAASCVITFLVQ